MRTCLALLLLQLASPRQESPPIAHLIEQLDHAELERRQNAEDQLTRIGKPALEALGRAIEEGSGEVQARARRAHRRIMADMGVWEIDPLPVAKETATAHPLHGKHTKVVPVSIPGLERWLPRQRLFRWTYCYGRCGDFYGSGLLSVDIEGNASELIDRENGTVWIRGLLLAAAIRASSAEERLEVMKIWIQLLGPSLGHLDIPSDLQAKQVEDPQGGYRISVDGRNWAEPSEWRFDLRFDAKGRLADLGSSSS